MDAEKLGLGIQLISVGGPGKASLSGLQLHGGWEEGQRGRNSKLLLKASAHGLSDYIGQRVWVAAGEL